MDSSTWRGQVVLTGLSPDPDFGSELKLQLLPPHYLLPTASAPFAYPASSWLTVWLRTEAWSIRLLQPLSGHTAMVMVVAALGLELPQLQPLLHDQAGTECLCAPCPRPKQSRDQAVTELVGGEGGRQQGEQLRGRAGIGGGR